MPFLSVTGTAYFPDGNGGCTPQPAESLVVDNASQPGNTTYGITRPDGRGDTKFTDLERHRTTPRSVAARPSSAPWSPCP